MIIYFIIRRCKGNISKCINWESVDASNLSIEDKSSDVQSPNKVIPLSDVDAISGKEHHYRVKLDNGRIYPLSG
jgi:hypothetical protein